MAKSESLDNMYMDIAERVSNMSQGRRAKVGSVLVKGSRIISYGWNGTPSGDDNNCEIENPDGTLTTKPEVLHSESNCLMKLAASGGEGSAGSVMYLTMSPCVECAKLIKQAGISKVFYREQYRDTSGEEFLKNRGVQVEQLKRAS